MFTGTKVPRARIPNLPSYFVEGYLNASRWLHLAAVILTVPSVTLTLLIHQESRLLARAKLESDRGNQLKAEYLLSLSILAPRDKP